MPRLSNLVMRAGVSKRKIILVTVAAWCLIAAMMLTTVFDNAYVNYSRWPVPEEARTVPYEAKGVVVYITEQQSRIMMWLWRIEIISGLAMALSIAVIIKWPPELRK